MNKNEALKQFDSFDFNFAQDDNSGKPVKRANYIQSEKLEMVDNNKNQNKEIE